MSVRSLLLLHGCVTKQSTHVCLRMRGELGGLEENISINEMQMPGGTCEDGHGFEKAAWAREEQKETHY